MSGRFAKMYSTLGYKTVPIDLLLGTNIFDFKYKEHDNVVGIISHPPCTEFAGSGARWWEEKAIKQPHLLTEAIAQVKIVLEIVEYHKPKFWFIENPVGRICKYIPLGEPRLIFNPWEYAGWIEPPWPDTYTKKTLLWGNFNIPERKPVDAKNLVSRARTQLSSKDKMKRSLTPLGFARAFVASNQP